MENLLLYITSTLLVVLCGFIFCAPKKPYTYYFLATCIMAFFWTLSVILTLNDPSRVLFWTKVSFLVPPLIIAFLFGFIDNFSNYYIGTPFIKGAFNRSINGSLILLLIIASIVSLSDKIIQSVVNLHTTFGPYQIPYIIILGLSFIWLTVQFYVSRLYASKDTLGQLKIVSVGIIISFTVAILFNLLLPLISHQELRFLGPFGLLFFIFTTTYAIITNNFLDIRIFISRAITYGVIFGIIILLFSSSIILGSKMTAQGIDSLSDINWKQLISSALSAFFIGLSYEPLRKYFQKKTDRMFFKEEYDLTTTLDDIASKLNEAMSLEEALNTSMSTLAKALHLKNAISYVLLQNSEGDIHIQSILPLNEKNRQGINMEQNHFVLQYMNESLHSVLFSDLTAEIEEEKYMLDNPNKKIRNMEKNQLANFIRHHAIKQSLHKKMTQLELNILIPITLNHQLISLFGLGNKLSNEPYYQNDLELIDQSTLILTNIIQKARLYEGNQMKTEFVSIASHELLTPISAMNGYLSMILDENIGKIDHKAKSYLENAYASTQRLALLVKDLLTVSRLDSGSLEIKPVSINIEKMIEDTITLLKPMADKKELTLVFEKSGTILPNVLADPSRLQEIIDNLLSNSIKYTPKGSVVVKCKLHQPSKKSLSDVAAITTQVEDTGIGIEKYERTHMFQKFYRAENDFTMGVMGTGLGLYIIKTTLEKMSGSIHYTPKSDHGETGSIFEFTLPVG